MNFDVSFYMYIIMILVLAKILKEKYLLGINKIIWIKIKNYQLKKLILFFSLIIFSIFFVDKPMSEILGIKSANTILNNYKNNYTNLSTKKLKKIEKKAIKQEKIKNKFKKISILADRAGRSDFVATILIIMLCYSILFKKTELETITLTAITANLYSGIFVQFLKLFFSRERPFLDLNPFIFFDWIFKVHRYKVLGYGNSSFPSGHTITAFSIGFVFYFYCKNKFIKGAIIFYTITVGIFRIYETAHWFSDVLVSAILGILIASSLYEINKSKIKHCTASRQNMMQQKSTS